MNSQISIKQNFVSHAGDLSVVADPVGNSSAQFKMFDDMIDNQDSPLILQGGDTIPSLFEDEVVRDKPDVDSSSRHASITLPTAGMQTHNKELSSPALRTHTHLRTDLVRKTLNRAIKRFLSE